MKRNVANLTALSILVPCLLYAGEFTNQAPPSVSTEKTNEVEPSAQAPLPSSAIPVRTKIVYKPPLRGAPAVRIDGGSRGSGVSLICLTVLAPDHTGLTVQEQPSLFWYQSEPADVPFELTVLENKKAQPILDMKLPNAHNTGIQRLKLSDYHVTLSPGIEYEWVVALVVDPDSRSRDVVASGYIERAAPSAALSARLANASKIDLPGIYAEEGVWYDALEAVSDLVDTQPNNASWRTERADLLQQAGVTNAASASRN
jgi:hypothetical protein